MYTWGYIKDVILAKLNMTEVEAKNNNFLNRFIMYANECLNQIASTIRPKQATYIVEVLTKDGYDKAYKEAYDKIIENWQESQWFEDEENFDLWLTIHKEQIEDFIKDVLLKDKVALGTIVSMPEDFLHYNGQSMVYWKQIIDTYGYDYHRVEKLMKEEVNPENIRYIGERQFIPLRSGKYVMEYDANWVEILETIKDDYEFDIPFDVMNCIPPYVAAQCWAIDDIQRSAILMNEFEKAFARINCSDYRNNEHFVPEGGW